MASVDAAINVVVNNLNRIKELEDKLKGIEGTIGAVQDLMERGVTGRATTVETYIRAVQELSKSLRAVAQEATGISKVNSELKQRILLESKLRREQSRVARLSRAFDVETRGLDQTKGSLLKIKQQFDEVSKALKQAFKIQDVGLISQLRNELSALIEDQREYNRVLAGTKNTGIDTDFLKEQARGYKLQIDQLRRRASALTENEEIIRKLTAAEYNLVKQRTKEGTFTSFADPRLGREILANVKAQIAAEEQLARERQRASDAYLQQQKNARREILQTVNIIAGTAKKAAGATFDALTFGQGGKIARGAQNAAIRGGVGLGALGLGKLTAGVGTAAAATAGFMTQGPQALVGGPAIAIIEKFAQVLNSALGGIPDAVAQALSSIGQIPDSLGLAAVAAFALAPAMSTVAKSVYNLGKAAGDTAFGQPVAKFLREVNPLAGAAFGSVQALQQGLDKLRGQQLDLQAIASSAAAVNDKLNESYRKLPLALPAKGGSSFQGVIEYDPGIGAFAGGGARKVLSNAEFLVGATGNLAARSEEAAAATLMFAERLGNGATEATIAANKLEEGAQSAKRIAEYVKQAQERRQSSAETPAQRFIRENIERGRRIRENEQSVQIARERSRALLGAQYSLLQIPARGELFPGGRTETRQPQYREMLNNAARVGQLQQEILESMSKQQGFAATLGQLERRTINDKGQSLAIQKQENEELERSIQIIRARNKELRQRPIAAMEPKERVQQGILDPVSLRQSRRNRVARGRALQESRTRALSEGLIGGAFPLLFGQGLGASVGGGLGGALGGFAGGGLGFGLSLIGTAAGTAIDTLGQKAIELGAALNDTSKIFDLAKERSFFSSREIEKLATKLQEAGLVASASAIAQREIFDKIGADGIEKLERLESASDKMNRALAELGIQLQVFVAGPLAEFLERVANAASSSNQVGRFERLTQQLSPGRSRELTRRATELITSTPGVESSFRALRRATGTGGGGTEAPGTGELGRLATEGKLAPLLKEFEAELVFTPKIKDEEQFKSQISAYGKLLESIDVAKPIIDQVRNAAREQRDLDKQRVDLVRSYEESIADIRRRVEDEIANRRFSVLEKENQLLDLQGQNRIKRLQIANREAIALAGRGERDEVANVAREVAQIVADFTEEQLSAEEEAAKIKRDAALDALKFDFESLKFKSDVEREVSKLNIETARRVADINEEVRRRNEETDSKRFDIERSIAIIKARQLQNELSVMSFAPNLDQIDRDLIVRVFDALSSNILKLGDMSAPDPLEEIGSVGKGGVSTSGITEVILRGKNAIALLIDEMLSGVDIASQGAASAMQSRLQTVADNIDKSLSDIETREADAETARLRRIELVNAGLTDGVAQRVIELEQVKRIALAQYDVAIAQLESKIVAGAVTAQVSEQNRLYLQQIEIIRQRKDALEGKFGEFDAQSGAGTGAIGETVALQKGREIQDFITTAMSELNSLETVAVNVSRGIGDAVGSSIANGISGLVQGTTTAKEVFANFLTDIGQLLVQEGTKMIATYVAIGIAKMFAGLGGASNAFGPGGAPNFSGALGATGPSFNPGAFSMGPLAADGAYFSNGIAAFAMGGAFTNSIVSSPTLFQFADGGALKAGVMGEAGPEAIMPLERGPDGRLGVRASLSVPFEGGSVMPEEGLDSESGQSDTTRMRRLAAAAASSLRIPFSGANGAGVAAVGTGFAGAAPSATASPATPFTATASSAVASPEAPVETVIRFESTVINGVEFVTRQEAEQIGRTAAARGADLAQRRLKNNPQVRRSIGI